MANVGKKVSHFLVLNFCFAKSYLQVWEDMWEKSGRKIADIAKKNLERICVWNDDIVKEISNKKDA